ncbi:hypothetical protein ACFVIM_13780 [Streptomyces sp. NPDC057638]|uniref:hypothetical protein n=1 Tax=Streptomyces sp. NPDC057638 TaxID=3346190 RepID=UPI00368A0180
MPDLSGRENLLIVGALLLAVGVVWWAVRVVRRLRRTATPAVWVAATAAVACTAYSADTSWRFAESHLDMGSTVERIAMFAAAELALVANSLLARQNLNGPNGTPGAPGVLVWVITGVQIIPAYAESGLVGDTVRAFVGPVMAALLWHLAMGIELRHHRPGAGSAGLVAVLGREFRERLLSLLGLAERDRDAAQITRDRAMARAVDLAARLAEKTPEQRAGRRGRRLARRLSAAVGRASVGDDQRQRRRLMEQLAARRHAVGLATIALPSPWDEVSRDPVASALAAQTREQMRQATGEIRRLARRHALFDGVMPGHSVDGEGRSPEQPSSCSPDTVESKRLSTEEARAVIEAGWAEGLTVRATAERATRAASYVHDVFVRLERERGVRMDSGRSDSADGESEPSTDSARRSQ